MNDRNNSSENRSIPDSVWVNLLARLSSADMDDLELDGQLRMLGRISSNEQFVDNVLNAIDTNLQSETCEKSRLPVLVPAWEVIPDNASPSHSESHKSSRLPVPTPVFETTSCDVSPSDSPVDQDLLVALAPQGRLKGFSFTKLLIVTGSLGVSLFIAFSVFDWAPNAQINVSDSATLLDKTKKQAETLAPTNANERASSSSQTNDWNGFEVANSTNNSVNQSNSTQHGIADPVVKNAPPNNVEAQFANAVKMPEDNVPDPVVKLFIHELFPRGIHVEPEPKPVVKNAPPNNVEAQVVNAAKMPEDNVPDKLVPAPVVKFIPDAELDWKLAIEFDKDGVGAIKLNGDEISEPLISNNASRLLMAVTSEVKRRFSFLEPRLGKRLKGVVTVGETNFYFDDDTKLNEAMKLACVQISRLEFPNQSAKRMMELRSKFRSVTQAKAQAEFLSVDIMNEKGFFYYDNESHLIREIVGKTEQALQKMAVDRLAWEKRNAIRKMEQDDAFKRLAQEKELANTSRFFISTEAFRQFAKLGKLVLPPTYNSFASTRIQKLSPSQLKTQLSIGTDSFNIFRDLPEFKSAENFVINETLEYSESLVKLNQIEHLRKKRKLAKDRKQKSKSELLIGAFLRGETGLSATQAKIHEIRAEAFEPLRELLLKRPDLEGLPLVMGKECHMDSSSASAMDRVSRSVGDAISNFDAFGSRDISQNDDVRLAVIMEAVKNEIERCFNSTNSDGQSRRSDGEQVLRTIDQILQIDHPRLRLELVETLRQIESPASIEMLVKRAKYDLVPEIRQAATNALSDYSNEKFRGQLLDGLKYPWHIVAQHSAEALVRLDDQDAVPELVEMLKLANPSLPKKVDEDVYVQRELVAVNHMQNCMLCHAPSRAEEDLGRGLSPSWDRPVPRKYYRSPPDPTTRAFVRADIVYLRQDFSALQTVVNNGFWPKEQRFDYLVQNKKMNEEHAQKAIKKITKQPNLNREAIVYALRELTDQQPADDSYETWLTVLEKRKVDANLNKKAKLDDD